jgi:hypothetical protein
MRFCLMFTVQPLDKYKKQNGKECYSTGHYQGTKPVAYNDKKIRCRPNEHCKAC